MSISCKVRFLPQKPNGYLSGDCITGELILETTCKLPIKEISVVLEGRMYIEWEDLESRNKQGLIYYFMQPYTNEDTFLTIRQILLSNVTIEHGKYVYHFKIQTPEAIPSSCSIKASHIKYEFSVIIHDAVNLTKLQTIPLTIRRNFHGTLQHELIKAVKTDFLEIFWWWRCRAKPFTATVTLSSATFSPGSNLEYTILMHNPNRYFGVQNVSVVLLQLIQYTATQPREHQRRDVTSIAFKSYNKPCGALTTRSLKDHLKLPKTLLNTSLEACAIMISYKLQIHIDMGFLQRSGSLTLPIIIDTCYDMHEKQAASICFTDDKGQLTKYATTINMDGITLEPPNELDTLEVSV